MTEKEEVIPEVRYGVNHHWGDVSFFLEDFRPHEDECKYLLLKILEQSIRDYVNLDGSESSVEKQYFETARDFLFSDEYVIDFGGSDHNLSSLLDILDIGLEWFREHVVDLKNRKAEVPELPRRLIGKSVPNKKQK